MPTIDITGVDWDEVGPDLYLALKELVQDFEYHHDATESCWWLPKWEEARKQIARVEGKE